MLYFATQVLEFFLTVKILSYLQILLKLVLNKPEGGGTNNIRKDKLSKKFNFIVNFEQNIETGAHILK